MYEYEVKLLFVDHTDRDSAQHTKRLQTAIARVLNQATEVDIDGADVWDSEISGITVTMINHYRI